MNMEISKQQKKKSKKTQRYFGASDSLKDADKQKRQPDAAESFDNKEIDRRKEVKKSDETKSDRQTVGENKHDATSSIKKKKKHRSFKMQKYKDESGENMEQQVYKVDLKRTEHTHGWLKEKGKFKSKLQHKKQQNLRMEKDPFPGKKPIPRDKIKKYERGSSAEHTDTRSVKGSHEFQRKEKKIELAAKEAARTEFLMQEDEGFLEADEYEDTARITQHDLADAVDVTSAQKFFELKLTDFGPYRINYTRNGRFLLFGGAKGHVAAIDWMTKKLLCEVNVMETIHDVKWLHQETMYAVAQKQWTYIYDNQGIELHCLKALDRVLRMEFLPYHFLLATSNAVGYLSYIDVSVGEKVAGYATKMGRLDVMCQNPANAVVTLGHSGGVVTHWCPRTKEPLMKMLCHNSGVRSVAINKTGEYMATSGIDRTLKIWDLRTYKMLQSYKVPAGSGQLAFSQKGLLATCMGNIVQIYQNCCRNTTSSPYLVHNLHASVQSLQFCPYEDVLGVGHADGFSSLIVPGAGEPNFDALESNPYQSKKQRQEAEVKMLLEKIPAEMIHINTNIIAQVDQKTLQKKIDEHNKIKHLKPMKLEYEPKYKKRGRSKGAKYLQRKKGVIEEHKRKDIKEAIAQKQEKAREDAVTKNRNISQGNVLARFKRKET